MDDRGVEAGYAHSEEAGSIHRAGRAVVEDDICESVYNRWTDDKHPWTFEESLYEPSMEVFHWFLTVLDLLDMSLIYYNADEVILGEVSGWFAF
ncbi:MAG: hypothetical protein GTO14_14410 [Anaerolineales bacterium]|nr:hypothetical protein [Anaerolineales bacterium]